MKTGDKVLLEMKKNLCVGKTTAQMVYVGKIVTYDEQKERLYIELTNTSLEHISLDGLYECQIYTEKETYSCTGVIEERYYGKQGKTIKFKIKNGFYKINVKSVDK